jgi:hypothetical protein
LERKGSGISGHSLHGVDEDWFPAIWRLLGMLLRCGVIKSVKKAFEDRGNEDPGGLRRGSWLGS